MRGVCLLLIFASAAVSAEPPSPAFSRGQSMLADYFRVQSKQISGQCLSHLTTRDAWEKERPRRRQQFLEMMGLWPMPPRTDLKATITSKFETDTFRVEKLHFQSSPGLYVTANLYLPKGDLKRAPAVLYVCGHGNVVKEGVSYGSKTHYQYHPAWFASKGYVCLILDTLQLHEIPGLHHGTYREQMWWWHNRGYTPGGIELWNGIRALDYLETRSEVDPKRIGLTGRSGGGATSWWIAAADERIQAVVPVAGFADLQAHISDGQQPGTPERLHRGVIAGHCDCMYPVNTYRWDFADIAALIAPRPLLLGNSDMDSIFPVAGYRRIAEKVRKVYALYDADERFQLLETSGPHKDTPELRVGINRWLNRWLKTDTTTTVTDDLSPLLEPQQLRVLGKTAPEDAINTTIHESFIKPARIDLPESAEVARSWWPKQRETMLAELQTKVFAGWTQSPPELKLIPAGEVQHDGVRMRAFDFVSEVAIELRLFVLTANDTKTIENVVLTVCDDLAWKQWCRDTGPKFAQLLQAATPQEVDAAKFKQNRAVMRREKIAFAAFCPRGVGPTQWTAAGTPEDIHIRRRFPLLGQTLDGQRVWDTRRAIEALLKIPGFEKQRVRLHGERDAAGIALYAGLFEPRVTELDLWQLPTSHRLGPFLLNVSRVCDLPQTVAMIKQPLSLHIPAKERNSWDWPIRLQQMLRTDSLKILTDVE